MPTIQELEEERRQAVMALVEADARKDPRRFQYRQAAYRAWKQLTAAKRLNQTGP